MDKKVTIDAKTGCPYCVAAKEDLKKWNVRFEEINVYEKPEAKKKVVELTGRRLVPVIVDGNSIAVGFQGGG